MYCGSKSALRFKIKFVAVSFMCKYIWCINFVCTCILCLYVFVCKCMSCGSKCCDPDLCVYMYLFVHNICTQYTCTFVYLSLFAHVHSLQGVRFGSRSKIVALMVVYICTCVYGSMHVYVHLHRYYMHEYMCVLIAQICRSDALIFMCMCIYVFTLVQYVGRVWNHIYTYICIYIYMYIYTQIYV